MRRTVCHLLDKDINLDAPYFWSIVRQHDRDRYPVIFCTTARAGALQKRFEEAGTPQFSLNVTARWQYPLAILRLARLLRREKVSIVHAHFFDPTFVGLIAARLSGARFVFTRHHSDHNIRINKKWHTKIDAWCGSHADHVIAVSEATRRIMIDIEGAPADRITTVYNGMNPLCEPAADSVERVRQELGLGPEPVILMLARLHEEKGHRFLLDAIPEIQSRVGRVTVLLGGDGPHRAELEAMARARGVEEVVKFLGRRSDVAELISLSSLLVLPSLAESFGFVLAEAMSLGKPVVASTTGGIPEVVAHEKTGLLVPPADSKWLAEAVSKVIQSPELSREMGEQGRKRAALFSFDQMMHGYEAVYERVLSPLPTTALAAPVNESGLTG